MPSHDPILIAGGGIGGLAAGIALRRLGLDEALVRSGRRLDAGSIRRPDGKVNSRADLAEVGRAVGAPVVAIHRATLQHLLFDALRLGRLGQLENAAARWLRDHLLALTPAAVTRAQLVRSLAFET